MGGFVLFKEESFTYPFSVFLLLVFSKTIKIFLKPHEQTKKPQTFFSVTCTDGLNDHRSLKGLAELYPVLHYISGVQIADLLGSILSHGAFPLLKRVKGHEEGTVQIMRWRGNFFRV